MGCSATQSRKDRLLGNSLLCQKAGDWQGQTGHGIQPAPRLTNPDNTMNSVLCNQGMNSALRCARRHVSAERVVVVLATICFDRIHHSQYDILAPGQRRYLDADRQAGTAAIGG